MARKALPVPPFFNPASVGEVWRVPYQERAGQAELWAREHCLSPAAEDDFKIGLLAVDVQNTFCIPGFELFVAGRSGTGAVNDNQRLCEFVYRNLDAITRIIPTMDTHQAMQIFHAVYLVDETGEHPEPLTLVSVEDVERGRWRFNPALCWNLGVTEEQGRQYLLHYVRSLQASGKYDLTIWPYHAMLGGIGHALVSAVEEAVFFHTLARHSQPEFEVKGSNPFTEHYSVLGPEVTEGPKGEALADKNGQLVAKLLEFDAVIIAGQAKSHCVAWTIDDLLEGLLARDEALARKVYLLEDCTSPVVVPGVIDYTEQADAAFRRFSEAGMHVVRSTDPMSTWPGMGKS
jgi:nicotinamidase-related amidase